MTSKHSDFNSPNNIDSSVNYSTELTKPFSFDIRDFLDQLTPNPKEKEKYICPNCNSHNLSVNLKNGKFNCWNCGDTKAIARELTKDLPQNKQARKSNNNVPPKPLQNIEIASQPIPDDIPEKVFAGQDQFQTIYPYSQNQWVERLDSNNGKKCIPHHLDSRGCDIAKKGLDQWFPYRINDVMLHGQDKYPLLVEGEKCVEAARAKGLIATTFLGSDWTDKGLEQGLLTIKDTGIAGLIMWPDNDDPGIKKARKVQEVGDRIGLKIIVLDPKSIWREMPEKGDIVDFLEAHPSINGKGLVNRLKLAEELERINTSKSNPKNNVIVHPTALHLSLEDQLSRAERIVKDNPSEKRQTVELNAFAKEANLSASEARKLIKAVEWEEDFNSDLIQSRAEFENLVKPVEINLYEIFPEPLAKALLSCAESARVDPMRVLQTVLPLFGSIIGGKLRIVLKEGATPQDNWHECCVFYTVDVGDPSTGKSVIQRFISQALQDKQKAEHERVVEARKELEEIAEEWDKMSPDIQEREKDTEKNPKVFAELHCHERRWLFDQATIQSFEKRVAEQPEYSGVLWLRDELSGLFNSVDQFTAGKGDGVQFILSGYNGPLRGMVDRVKETDSFRFNGQCMNIAGGLQPKFINKFWSTTDDPDGLASRILPVLAKIPDNFDNWSDATVDIYDVMESYINKLEALDVDTVRFSYEAHQEYVKYWEYLRKGLRLNLEDNPAYAYFLGKQCSYTGRFALLIHTLNCVATGQPITTPVDVNTIRKAIKLSRFYCHQYRLLQTCSQKGEATLDGLLLQVYEFAKEKGTISTRDIYNHRKFKQLLYQGQKINASVALKIFEAIALAGYGELDGKNFTAAIAATLQRSATPSNQYQKSGTEILQPLQPLQPDQSQKGEKADQEPGQDKTASTRCSGCKTPQPYTEQAIEPVAKPFQTVSIAATDPVEVQTPHNTTPQSTTLPNPTPEQQKWESLKEGNVIVFAGKKYELDLYNHHENYWLIYSIPDENERQLHPSDNWEFTAD